jgi:GIY-YIG catalytic domain
MEIGYIYCLSDPHTLEKRYVGKSQDPYARLKKHLWPSYLKPETYKNRWLRQLKAIGSKPILSILEVVQFSNMDIREKFWIAQLRIEGAPLTNTTIGGDGGATFQGRHHTLESISIIKNKQKGRKWDANDPRRELIRAKQKGHAPMHATIKALEHNIREWELISPLGNIFKVKNLSNFCQKNNLAPRHLYEVAKGDSGRTHHKGWKCKELTV